MQEELTLREPLSRDRQQEVIQTYCADLEERIQSARERSEAETIVQEACSSFDRECESSIVRTFLKQYAQKVLLRYWSP